MGQDSGKKLLFDASAMANAIDATADAVLEECRKRGGEIAGLLGIQTGGIPLARRIAKRLREQGGLDLPAGTLDISMYRDDIGTRRKLPLIRETEIPFDLNGKQVILVDDVLHTGRTIRAALDALTDYGRPSAIRLVVLVDRGGHEFPIRADFTGLTVNVPEDSTVRAEWSEYNMTDAIYEMARKTAGK